VVSRIGVKIVDLFSLYNCSREIYFNDGVEQVSDVVTVCLCCMESDSKLTGTLLGFSGCGMIIGEMKTGLLGKKNRFKKSRRTPTKKARPL
jgi:hypothetical protein